MIVVPANTKATPYSIGGGCSPTITTAGTTASQQIKVLKRWKRKSILSAVSERTTDKIVTDTEL